MLDSLRRRGSLIVGAALLVISYTAAVVTAVLARSLLFTLALIAAMAVDVYVERRDRKSVV